MTTCAGLSTPLKQPLVGHTAVLFQPPEPGLVVAEAGLLAVTVSVAEAGMLSGAQLPGRGVATRCSVTAAPCQR